MTKPVEKTAAPPLVHHPSDVLDLFGCYNATNQAWSEFDRQMTALLLDFEAKNKDWFTPRAVQREFKRSLGR